MEWCKAARCLFKTATEDNAVLYGFSGMIYRERGKTPPVGQWAFGTYHEVSNDTWTERWKAGQAKPTLDYTGGYR